MEDGFSNKFFLVGEIVSLEPARFSPAGIPIARAVVRHESWQSGQKMQFELTVAAQAELAIKLNGLKPGSRIKLCGPLSRANQNSRNLLMWIEDLNIES